MKINNRNMVNQRGLKKSKKAKETEELKILVYVSRKPVELISTPISIKHLIEQKIFFEKQSNAIGLRSPPEAEIDCSTYRCSDFRNVHSRERSFVHQSEIVQNRTSRKLTSSTLASLVSSSTDSAVFFQVLVYCACVPSGHCS